MLQRAAANRHDAFEKQEDSPTSSQTSSAGDGPKFDKLPQSYSQPRTPKYKFSKRSAKLWKVLISFIGVSVLFAGRFVIPDNEVSGIQDKVLIAFQGWNDWVRDDNNAFIRNMFLILCTAQIDVIFFATVYRWVKHGRTGRLLASIAVFYVTRAIVQNLWWTPYPSGYYWTSPGLPSFVAPYGRGTDFFFSGHSGFLVLMANEWNKWGSKRMRNYIWAVLAYTVLILVVYQAHYSIDIFTGVFFADYCFGKVDKYKGVIDNAFKRIGACIQGIFSREDSDDELSKVSIQV